MKKFICLVLSLALVGGCLTGCLEDGSKPKKEVGDGSSVAADAGSKEEVFGLNETAVFDTLKFTATELRVSNGDDFFKPENGNVFVGINFSIENISDEEQVVSGIMLFDGYADDVKCSYSISAAAAFSGGTVDGTVAPGKKLVGWYALEVPENWSDIELAVKSDWMSNHSAKFVFTK